MKVCIKSGMKYFRHNQSDSKLVWVKTKSKCYMTLNMQLYVVVIVWNKLDMAPLRDRFFATPW